MFSMGREIEPKTSLSISRVKLSPLELGLKFTESLPFKTNIIPILLLKHEDGRYHRLILEKFV